MPPQRREVLLLEFERSGLPASKFAQLAGVRYQTFATWVQNHKKRRATTGAAASAEPLRFAEVVLPGRASIELHEISQMAR